MVNLELYRIFYVVAECKNITKASEKLLISQPAVTKHIKNLEDSLGEILFIRTKRGVVLTDAGNKLYIKVRQAINLINDGELIINEDKNNHNSTIKIGISTTLAKVYLMDYIDKFHKIYPNVIFDIYTDSTYDLIKKLKVGEIDFIICKRPNLIDNDLKYEILGNTKYIFVASNKYKVKHTLDIKKLENIPILLQREPSNSRTSVEEYFKENNIVVNPKMNIASSNLLVNFVKMNFGIGYVTKLYVEEYLKDGTLVELNIKPSTKNIDYGIITLKNNVIRNDVKLFIKSLEIKKDLFN